MVVYGVCNFVNFQLNNFFTVFTFNTFSSSKIHLCRTEFLITASVDGHVKFWKKKEDGIEFVKHFRSHLGSSYVTGFHPQTVRKCFFLFSNFTGTILDMAGSFDGEICCTIADDKTLKVFDVINFGLCHISCCTVKSCQRIF